MRKWAGVVALCSLAFGLGQALAQGGIPDGAFVRDSGGNVWLVAGGQRAGVPIYQATDDQIAAVPDGGQWLIPAGDGSGALILGARPSWAGGVATPGQTAAGTTPVPDDALPTVTIQLDDPTINPGQRINVTVIASDDKGLQRIDWEGTIIDGDDNDNRRTDDPELDARHRFDCDGQKQCANVWQITPTKSGRFTLRARATDDAEQRGPWSTVELRVR